MRFIPSGILIPTIKLLSVRYCRNMNLIISPSSQMKDILISYGITKRIEVIPTGVKLDFFHAGDGKEFRKRRGIPENTRILLFVGRIAKEKNIGFLFQVLRRIVARNPGVRLLLAGDGPDKEQLMALVLRKKLDAYVDFLGYLEMNDLIPCYAAADVLLMASKTETQGLVVAEAMATGTPVVAIAEMGVVDVLEGDRGGVLVNSKVDEFAGAVTELLDDEALYRRKSTEARDTAYRFSIDATTGRLVELYSDLLDGEKRSR